MDRPAFVATMRRCRALLEELQLARTGFPARSAPEFEIALEHAEALAWFLRQNFAAAGLDSYYDNPRLPEHRRRRPFLFPVADGDE